MNKIQSISKRTKIIILILFELNAVLIGATEYMLNSGKSEALEKSDDYMTLLVIYIFLSIVYLILPWFMERILKFYASRRKREYHLFTLEGWRLVLSYVLLFSPTIFGQILLETGLPFSQFSFFLVTTIIMTLIWGINDLRKRPAPDLVQ